MNLKTPKLTWDQKVQILGDLPDIIRNNEEGLERGEKRLRIPIVTLCASACDERHLKDILDWARRNPVKPKEFVLIVSMGC